MIRKGIIQDYHCRICGFVMPVARSKARLKRQGHTMMMICLKCNRPRTFRLEVL